MGIQVSTINFRHSLLDIWNRDNCRITLIAFKIKMGTKGVVISLALFMCTWRCFAESTVVPEHMANILNGIGYSPIFINQKKTCAEKFQINIKTYNTRWNHRHLDTDGYGDPTCEKACTSNKYCRHYFLAENGWCALYYACNPTRTTSAVGITFTKVLGDEPLYDCQYCCVGTSCASCPGYDGMCTSLSCIYGGECDKCCTKLAKVPGCPNDLWSQYVTKQSSNTIDTLDEWEVLYSAQDLSALEASINVGNPYTLVYNVTSKCSSVSNTDPTNIKIGFAGGFMKAEVPNCGAYVRLNKKCGHVLMVARGNWIGNGNSPTKLTNYDVCRKRNNELYGSRPMEIHNIYLFEGLIEVDINCLK